MLCARAFQEDQISRKIDGSAIQQTLRTDPPSRRAATIAMTNALPAAAT